MSGSYRFPRSSRLRRSSEIRDVFRSGRRRRCGPVDLVFGSAAGGVARVAVVVPRFDRTAPERNRLKRRIREILRIHWLPGKPREQLVVRARRAAFGCTYAELRDAILACLEVD